MSVLLFVFVYVSVCLSLSVSCLSFCLFVSLSISLAVYPSVRHVCEDQLLQQCGRKLQLLTSESNNSTTVCRIPLPSPPHALCPPRPLSISFVLPLHLLLPSSTHILLPTLLSALSPISSQVSTFHIHSCLERLCYSRRTIEEAE